MDGMERLVFYSFLIVDALVFMMLLVHFSEDTIDMRTAVGIVGGVLAGTLLLTMWFVDSCGWLGLPISMLLAAGVSGILLSWCFGMEIKRALFMGGLFAVIHVGFVFVFPHLV